MSDCRAAAVTIEEASPAGDDARHCLEEYFRELARRFEGGFDPAQSLDPTPAEFRPPKGVFLLLRLHGRPVGCGAFKAMPPDAAYLKRMWIAPEVRGLGLGKRLLAELERRARDVGYRRARLETNQALSEAQALYLRCGYREVAPFNAEPYAHHWFEKPLA